MVNGGRYKNGKTIYHKSELQHISVALRSFFKIPKGTEVKDGENGVTFIYPSGKRYVRYFSSADPLVVKKRLPPDTKVERYKDKTVYKYPSGKKFTERTRSKEK